MSLRNLMFTCSSSMLKKTKKQFADISRAVCPSDTFDNEYCLDLWNAIRMNTSQLHHYFFRHFHLVQLIYPTCI